MRGHGLNTPRHPMRWSERVALVSRELSEAEAARAVERYLASLAPESRVERDAEDSPLGEFVNGRRINRRPLHTRHGRMRQSNG